MCYIKFQFVFNRPLYHTKEYIQYLMFPSIKKEIQRSIPAAEP